MLAVAQARRDPLRGLRRLLGRQPARPHRRRRREARHHRRRRLPQGQGLVRSSPPSTWRSPIATAPACRRPSSTCWSCAAAATTWSGPRAATSGGTTSCPQASAEHEAQAFPAENPLFILYTSGTTGKPKGILHTSGGYLTQAAFTQQGRPRHPSRIRRVLVHGRHRLGHGPHLRDLRPARQRRHAGALRGHARHAAPRPLVGDHREVRRDDPLHRAHRHPLVHEARPRDPEEVRPVVAAAARLGG